MAQRVHDSRTGQWYVHNVTTNRWHVEDPVTGKAGVMVKGDIVKEALALESPALQKMKIEPVAVQEAPASREPTTQEVLEEIKEIRKKLPNSRSDGELVQRFADSVSATFIKRDEEMFSIKDTLEKASKDIEANGNRFDTLEAAVKSGNETNEFRLAEIQKQLAENREQGEKYMSLMERLYDRVIVNKIHVKPDEPPSAPTPKENAVETEKTTTKTETTPKAEADRPTGPAQTTTEWLKAGFRKLPAMRLRGLVLSAIFAIVVVAFIFGGRLLSWHPEQSVAPKSDKIAEQAPQEKGKPVDAVASLQKGVDDLGERVSKNETQIASNTSDIAKLKEQPPTSPATVPAPQTLAPQAPAKLMPEAKKAPERDASAPIPHDSRCSLDGTVFVESLGRCIFPLN